MNFRARAERVLRRGIGRRGPVNNNRVPLIGAETTFEEIVTPTAAAYPKDMPVIRARHVTKDRTTFVNPVLAQMRHSFSRRLAAGKYGHQQVVVLTDSIREVGESFRQRTKVHDTGSKRTGHFLHTHQVRRIERGERR